MGLPMHSIDYVRQVPLQEDLRLASLGKPYNDTDNAHSVAAMRLACSPGGECRWREFAEA